MHQKIMAAFFNTYLFIGFFSFVIFRACNFFKFDPSVLKQLQPSLYKLYEWPCVSQTSQHFTMVTLPFAKNVNECF